MLKAAVQAKSEGICQPILLGNDERIEKLGEIATEVGFQLIDALHKDLQHLRRAHLFVVISAKAHDLAVDFAAQYFFYLRRSAVCRVGGKRRTNKTHRHTTDNSKQHRHNLPERPEAARKQQIEDLCQ